MAGGKIKYGNKRVQLDGMWFDSVGECDRWSDLKLLQRAGQISDLRRQVRIPLNVNGKLVTVYVADFCYLERNEQITEDWKGFETPEWKLKAKLFSAIFGKDIRVTGKASKDNGWMARKVRQRRAA